VQIRPRYDGEPLVEVRTPSGAAVAACARQRRRLAERLTGLDDAQWSAPSRCDGWTVKDVVSHLTSTNGFWAFSIAGGLAGSPTRLLEGFDPKATPAALAEADADTAVDEVRERFTASTEALCTAVEDLTPDQLALVGEAPPGHIALHGVVLHALWDSWVHERDIFLPLGLPVDEEPDEVAESLRYALALAPALALTATPDRRGRLGIDAADLPLACWIDAGPGVVVHEGPAPDGVPVLCGGGVELLEALSVRRPLHHDLPDDHRWLVEGLAVVFEEA
jgi:uncharacterized protein (TIGR03083 family)